MNEHYAEWIRLYRSGVTGAGVARACDVDDILEVLGVLAAARRDDAALEPEHSAHRRGRGHHPDSAAPVRELSAVWKRRIADLSAYLAEHGRMPRQGGGNEHETSLGRWLHNQRLKATKGTLLSEQRAALDAVGDWDTGAREQRDAKKFPANLKAVAQFRERHGRLPAYWNRSDGHEQALGLWLHGLRQAEAGSRLPACARNALDQQLPGWNK